MFFKESEFTLCLSSIAFRGPQASLASTILFLASVRCSWFSSTSVHWVLLVKKLSKGVCLFGGLSMHTTPVANAFLFFDIWCSKKYNFRKFRKSFIFANLQASFAP